METYKMLALSTAHLDSDTIDKLNNKVNIEGLIIYEKDNYGWFIPVFADELTKLEKDWYMFEKGTSRENIWHWFDERHSKGIAYLLYDHNCQ